MKLRRRVGAQQNSIGTQQACSEQHDTSSTARVENFGSTVPAVDADAGANHPRQRGHEQR